MTIASNIPPPNVPFLDDKGNVQMVWWQFLLSQFNRTGGTSGTSPGGNPVSVPLGASPVAFTAPADGTLFVSGGGVTNMQIARSGNPYFNTGQFYAPVPMSNGDTVRITFVSPPPAVTFLPR